jgi:hypothetical protein
MSVIRSMSRQKTGQVEANVGGKDISHGGEGGVSH